MTLDRPIVQTYVEIKYIKPDEYLYAKILDEILEEIRQTMYDEIGVRDDITGRATYSISSRGTYFKIWIEQYINTLSEFNANVVVQQIMERALKLGHEKLILETVAEYENLNGEILITCPKCKGSGEPTNSYVQGSMVCDQCNGNCYAFTSEPSLKIIPLAPKGF